MKSNLALAYLRQKYFKQTLPPAFEKGTYNVRELKREQLHRKRQLKIIGQEIPVTPDYWRPKTYEDCKMLPRPCPYVGCRYHLLLDETDTGGFKTNADLDQLEKMKYTCALDAANEGEKTLDEIGQMLGITRERVRQIEAIAIANFNEVAEILLNQTSNKAA